MKQAERFEREYREALDGLRFSEDAKECMMKNLMEQKEATPGKRRGARLLRTVLIAAAVCGTLIMTAGAAAVAAWQARITYLGPEQFRQGYNDYLEEYGHSSSQYNNGKYVGSDFSGCDAQWQETWWQRSDGELVEEAAGTAQDGWTAKRVFRSDLGSTSYGLRRGQTYVETRYQADQVSDYSSIFDCWNLSWLEGHYAPNPYGTFARTITYRDGLRFLAVGGEYQNGETQFHIGFSWDGSFVRGDEYRVAGNKEYAELYTTLDGVEVAIEMDTSDTGKSVFWAEVFSGHNSFEMFGTQMELDALHDILDSLHLSNLLEYTPES